MSLHNQLAEKKLSQDDPHRQTDRQTLISSLTPSLRLHVSSSVVTVSSVATYRYQKHLGQSLSSLKKIKIIIILNDNYNNGN